MGNPTVSQLPGELNIDMIDNDDMTFSVDWHMDITDYIFNANIIPTNCETEIPIGVDVIDATAGKINLIISASSILDISPSTNRWYLEWIDSGSSLRTVLNGSIVLRSR